MMVKEYCFHAQMEATIRQQEERIWQLEAELERLKSMV